MIDNKTILTFLAVATQVGLQAQEKAVQKPNIVFIFADDLGWGDLSCYGNNIQTPNLDRLASKGTLFTNFYVAGSVSSPSRVGILTGQYPARNLIFDYLATPELNKRRGIPDDLDPNVVTLADILKEGGYITGHFGKWHMSSTIIPAEYGFAEFRTDKASNIGDNKPISIWNPGDRPVATKRVLDETLAFIRRNQNKPFFVNAWLSDVHGSLNPSKEQLEKLNNLKDPRVDFYGVRQIFYAALVEMDRQIGLFLDTLEQMGLNRNTIIIFSSDNGPEDYNIKDAAHSGVGNPGPFRGRKRSIYDGGIRTPFIVSWPGRIPEATVNNNSIVSGVDFIPTLCSLTGTKLPPNLKLDGEDMSPALLGNKDYQRKNPLFWEWRINVFGHVYNICPQLAMRSGEWKFLMNPDGSRKELYNIVTDPKEIDNLAGENPKLVEKFSKDLLSWYKTLPVGEYKHPAAGNNTYPWPTEEKLRRLKK